jgi:thiol-disulfide isomerase/thioredoxin/outer membrane lipoprotein-sorting protein
MNTFLPFFRQSIIVIVSISVIVSLTVVSRADPSATPVLPNPLASAKTITVHEVLLFDDDPASKSEAKLVKMGDFDVSFSRPHSVRVDFERTNSKSDDSKNTKEFYVSDGISAHQYNGKTNEYSTLVKDKDGSYSSALGSVSNLTDIENGPKIASDSKTSRVTINGKQYVLTVVETPFPAAQDGSAQSLLTSWYFDPATGLPARKTVSVKTKDGEKGTQEFDFSNWTLNKKISPNTYAWNHPAGSKAHVDLPKPKLLGKGDIAPEITAVAPNGSSVKLSDLKGKVVVVDFWATWCAPCQASMPHLDKVYKQVKNQDVVVLAVCVWDNKESFDRWILNKMGVYSFPVAFDSAGRSGITAATPYGVTGIPAQFVIGKDGIIAGASVGYGDGDTDLEKNLAAAGVNVSN